MTPATVARVGLSVMLLMKDPELASLLRDYIDGRHLGPVETGPDPSRADAASLEPVDLVVVEGWRGAERLLEQLRRPLPVLVLLEMGETARGVPASHVHVLSKPVSLTRVGHLLDTLTTCH